MLNFRYSYKCRHVNVLYNDLLYGRSMVHVFGTRNILFYYSCGLSTATIEYSCPSVRLSVCLSVSTITQKIMV